MKKVYYDFVDGTDNEYDHPRFFKDSQDHAEEANRMKWRQYIKEEICKMEIRRVWKGIKRREVLRDRMIIGGR